MYKRQLDLFANMRTVKLPEEGIDWVFFRENTEGAYAVGDKGVGMDGLSVDFTITTDEGTRRIARLAYDYARANGRKRISIITKANVIKETDGKYLRLSDIGKATVGAPEDKCVVRAEDGSLGALGEVANLSLIHI